MAIKIEKKITGQSKSTPASGFSLRSASSSDNIAKSPDSLVVDVDWNERGID